MKQDKKPKLSLRQRLRLIGYRLGDFFFPFESDDATTEKPSNPKRTQQILLALLLGLIVFILSERIAAYAREQTSIADTRADFQYYQTRILEEQERSEELLAHFEELSSERNQILEELYARFSEQNLATDEEYHELMLTRHMAGMTEVRGEGLRISLRDESGIDYTGDDRTSIIHDADVRGTVNLLKSVPSSLAMDINGERVIATSRLICTGPLILVNRDYVSMPFVISVVGDSDELFVAFTESELYRSFLDRGLEVTVEAVADLAVPPLYDQELIDHSLNFMREVQ